MSAIIEATPEGIARFLDANPHLTREGLTRPRHVPPHKWRASLPREREALRSSVRQIETCLLALTLAKPASRGPLLDSYTAKHRIEGWAEHLGWPTYISNGSLILAAHLAGFSIVGPHVLNPKFGISATFLQGPRAGLEYRVAFSREEQGAADLWTSRVGTLASGSIAALDLATPGTSPSDAEASLCRCEGVLSSSGTFLRRRGSAFRFSRWAVREAKDTRAARLAGILGLRRVHEAMESLREPLARHAAGVIPVSGPPSMAELRAATQTLDAALRDLVETTALPS